MAGLGFDFDLALLEARLEFLLEALLLVLVVALRVVGLILEA